MIKIASYSLLKDFNVKNNNNPFCKYLAYYLEDSIVGYIE